MQRSQLTLSMIVLSSLWLAPSCSESQGPNGGTGGVPTSSGPGASSGAASSGTGEVTTTTTTTGDGPQDSADTTSTSNPGDPTDSGQPDNTSSPGPGGGTGGGTNHDCSALTVTGSGKGQVPENITLTDSTGKEVKFHEFCNKAVLIIAGSMR